VAGVWRACYDLVTLNDMLLDSWKNREGREGREAGEGEITP
jgi:hypothetical protein